MKYSIIHDAFWICYIYAVYISMLQFKMGSFNGTSNILNMVLAILTLITFLAFTYFVFKLGYKYRKEPEKIPKKYSFLMLEPSASPL
jgi:Ca2+/Na+ antiporter